MESEQIYRGESSADVGLTKFTKRSRFSFLDWVSVVLAFSALYVVFGLFFWAFLEAAEVVRGEDYRVLPPKYYGPFVYNSDLPIPEGQSSYPAGFDVPWNASLF